MDNEKVKNRETLILSSTQEDIKKAAALLRASELVAFPTETVYGLGANGLDGQAVKKIYEAKGRPSDNPMILHVAKKEDAVSLWEDSSQTAQLLMDEFWPGPLTIVMKSKDKVPLETRGGLGTVAVRMPKDEIALSLISEVGKPIAAPSANLSGRPSPTQYEHVLEDMDGRIAAVIKGDICQLGIESTVILIEDEEVLLLRPGFILPKDIEKVLGRKIKIVETTLDEQKDKAPLSPGMKYRHYAPKGDMTIFVGEATLVDEYIKRRKSQLEKEGFKVGIIDFSSFQLEYVAKNLFSTLRDMDSKGIEFILAKGLSQEDLGFAIMNRMVKSAGYKIETIF